MSAGLEEPSWEFLGVEDPVEMAEMAESMDEFLGAPFTFSILEDPGMAWEDEFVEVPSGFFTGSDTLLLSCVNRRGREDLRHG